jgi:hypothetical protein
MMPTVGLYGPTALHPIRGIMIEIIFLFLLCRDIGKIVRKNGRKAIGFQLALIALWFCGEFLGLIVGIVVTTQIDGRFEGVGILAYIFAIAGAIVGSIFAFRIAKSTRPKPMGSAFPVIMYDSSDTPDGPIR